MSRRPPYRTSDESINVTSINVTAILLPNRSLIHGHDDSLRALDELLPLGLARNEVTRGQQGLLFVHGHRHRDEWTLHANFLSLSPWASALHALLFCTDVSLTTAYLLRRLAEYPQRTRMLMHTGVNIGYRCGLLHSLAATRRLWGRYGFVIFTHPDVFLMAPAPALLEAAIASAPPGVALLATPTKMFCARLWRDIEPWSLEPFALNAHALAMPCTDYDLRVYM